MARELGELPADGPLARAWEALVAGAETSGFMQGLAWASFKRLQGLRVIHVGLFQDDALVGGTLAYAAPRGRGVTLLVSPDGPVLPWTERSLAGAGMQALHRLLTDVARREGAIAWRIEPRLPRPRPAALRNFSRAPVDLLPEETLLLDLSTRPEELLAAMHPKGRYNIRLAARKGVVVDTLTGEAGLDAFYAVLEQAATRSDFFLESRAFFAQLLEALAPGGHVHLLLARGAERETATPETCLGGLLLLTHGARATYLYGGVADRDRPRMAGYALQWAAIRLARSLGCQTYDFYGFDPLGRPDHPYARFSRFKRQFGGRPVRYLGAQEHFFVDRLADAVVRAVQEIGWS